MIAGVVRHARCWVFGVVALGGIGAALLAPCFAQASARPRGTLFHLVGARTYKPDVHSARLELRIPLSARSDVAIGKLGVELSDVELPGHPERVLFNAFSVQMAGKPSVAAHAPAVLMTIDEENPLSAGAYHVRFTLLSRHPRRRQSMSVFVQLPAPVLAVPPTVYIDRTSGWPASGTSDSGLVLHETSGLSRLAGLSIEQVQGPGGTDQGADGRVSVKIVPTVPAGQARVADVTIKGHFPLGTSTGQLEISSPQLKEPIPVTYQVQRRVWRGYLVLIIALGVALGFITRVWLVQRIQRGKAKVQAYGLLSQLGQERQRHADKKFAAQVDKAAEGLEAALRTGSAEEITTAVATASKELQTAQGELKTSLDKVAATVQSLQELLGTPWLLPDTVSEVLVEKRSSLEAIEKQLEDGDAGAATQASAALRSDLGNRVRRATGGWRKDATSLLDALKAPQPPVFASSAPGLMPSVEAASTQLGAEVFERADGSLDAVLTALDKSVRALDLVITRLRPVTSALAQLLGTAEQQALAADADPLAAHRQAIERFALVLRAADARKPSTLQDLQGSLQALGPHLTELTALVAPAPAPVATTSLSGDISSALAKGDVLFAARLSGVSAAVANSPAVAEAAATMSAIGAEGAGLAALAEPGPDAATLAAASPERPWMAQTSTPATSFSKPPAAALQISAFRRLAKDQALQSLLLGLVITGVGYLLFTDGFVGTTSDIIGAFGWGYTADITSAFVVNALSTGKGTAPAGGSAAPTT